MNEPGIVIFDDVEQENHKQFDDSVNINIGIHHDEYENIKDLHDIINVDFYMIKCILSEITVKEFSSDADFGLICLDYIPVRLEVKFIKMIKNKSTGKKVDGEYVVLESVDDLGFISGTIPLLYKASCVV